MMRDLASEVAESTWVDAFDDQALSEFGAQTCSLIDSGRTFGELADDIALTAVELRLTESELTLALQSIAISTMSICPEHNEAFLLWLEAGAPGVSTAPPANAGPSFDDLSGLLELAWLGRSQLGEPDEAWYYETYDLMVSESEWSQERLGVDEAVLGAETFCSLVEISSPDAEPADAMAEAALTTGFALGISDPHALLVAAAAAGAICTEDVYSTVLSAFRTIESDG